MADNPSLKVVGFVAESSLDRQRTNICDYCITGIRKDSFRIFKYKIHTKETVPQLYDRH